MKAFSPKSPVCFISTHFDDVVLSCTNFLEQHPNSTIITVLAGAPDKETDDVNSRYTAKKYAPDAVKVRKDEDAAAMDRLQANPICLDFWDTIYLEGSAQDESAIAEGLASAIQSGGAQSVIAPIGIRHPDHIAVANACQSIAKELDVDFYFYLDLPYGLAFPDLFTVRLNELVQRGIKLEELTPVHAAKNIKDDVFKLYKSQYDPTKNDFNDNHKLAYDETLQSPECYWRLVR